MVKTLSAACLLLLTGCVTSAHLIDDSGKRHVMSVDPVTNALATEINSVQYKGKYIMGESVGVGFSARGGMAIAGGSGNNGQAMLLAANGDFLDCGFMASGSTVMGRCTNRAGQQYILTTE